MSSVFVALRLGIGLLFVVSGLGKIISPVQNFAYVIESYDLLPRFWIHSVAYILPWIEFFSGAFVLLGLWLNRSLWAVVWLFLTFQFVVGQALIRHLPIDKCGCFGEWISLPLPVMFFFDTFMLLLTLFLIWKIHYTAQWSLDHFFKNR